MDRRFLLVLGLCALLAGGCDSPKVGAVGDSTFAADIVEKGTDRAIAGLVCEVRAGRRLLGSAVSSASGRIAVPHAGSGATVVVRDPAGAFVGGSYRCTGPGPNRIELERGAAFRLRILDDGGRPLDASITAWASGARVLDLSPLGGDRWGAVPTGPAHLVVASSDRRTAVLEVAIEADRRREPDLGELRLHRGGTAVRGKVAASGRSFPSRALLRWGGAGQFTPVAEDGTFELRGLPSSGGESTMLVLLRGDREVWARDLRVEGTDIDIGTIRLE